VTGSHGPSTRSLSNTYLGVFIWVGLSDMGGSCQSLVLGLICRTTYYAEKYTKTQLLHNVEKGMASYGSFQSGSSHLDCAPWAGRR
jgi:hypothetical protein